MSEETTGQELVPLPPEVMVPLIGEIVPTGDLDAVANAILAVRDAEGKLAAAKRTLTEVFTRKAQLEGEKTFHLDGAKVEVKNTRTKTYDAEEIEAQLRQAGMPENRIREIVVETTTYSVRAGEAKKAAGANKVYARIIEDNTTEHETAGYVSITRGLRGPSKGSNGKADSEA